MMNQTSHVQEPNIKCANRTIWLPNQQFLEATSLEGKSAKPKPSFLLLMKVQVKPLTIIVKHKAIPSHQHIMLYNVKDQKEISIQYLDLNNGNPHATTK